MRTLIPSPRRAVTAPACACGHDEGTHHPAGRCTVSLPPLEAEELPAWQCPCRQFVGERAPIRDAVLCRDHPDYWRRHCTGCGDARALTLALRSVQSCTVHAPA